MLAECGNRSHHGLLPGYLDRRQQCVDVSARGVHRLPAAAGEQLRVEWVDPSGVVATSAEYGELPAAGELW